MQTVLVTLLGVFLAFYYEIKRKFFLAALSLAIFFVLFRSVGFMLVPIDIHVN
jgi:multisubunit Na+/H+ antiporter MnhG subunit